jgi:flavorubredoxin
MARIDEIAPDLYRVSIYAPQFDLQFNHFLINDDEPLLFHTGMRRMFPEVRDAVAKVIDPAALRWISWSHFEVDECGALNEWLAVAPRAQAICGQLGAAINIEDFANRPPRGLAKDDVIETGRHKYRFVPTPHLPHGWDAGVLFEEKLGVLLCSDLFHQVGDVEPVTSADVLGRWDAAIGCVATSAATESSRCHSAWPALWWSARRARSPPARAVKSFTPSRPPGSVSCRSWR